MTVQSSLGEALRAEIEITSLTADEAASLRKLYLKIEKAQFYAMFGDFDTGLSVAELGRYIVSRNS